MSSTGSPKSRSPAFPHQGPGALRRRPRPAKRPCSVLLPPTSPRRPASPARRVNRASRPSHRPLQRRVRPHPLLQRDPAGACRRQHLRAAPEAQRRRCLLRAACRLRLLLAHVPRAPHRIHRRGCIHRPVSTRRRKARQRRWTWTGMTKTKRPRSLRSTRRMLRVLCCAAPRRPPRARLHHRHRPHRA